MLSRSRGRRLLLAFTAAAVLATMISGRAHAHGNLDQHLAGDGGCNTFNFPASAGDASGQRQEFVPSANGVSSVGVCVSTAAPGGASLNITVRSGTASSPGAALGGAAVVVAPGAPVDFTHVDFAAPLNVVPGQKLVIELSSAADLAWYGPTPGVDLYAPGIASSASVGDFAFRTYLAPGYVAPTPTKTKTPKPTPTRTATRTPTPIAPATTPPPGATAPPPAATAPPPAATAPPPAASAVAPLPSAPAPVLPAGPSPPHSSRSPAAPATPRTGSILPQYSGRIYLPDVGRDDRHDSEQMPSAVAVALLSTGLMSSLVGALCMLSHASGR